MLNPSSLLPQLLSKAITYFALQIWGWNVSVTSEGSSWSFWCRARGSLGGHEPWRRWGTVCTAPCSWYKQFDDVSPGKWKWWCSFIEECWSSAEDVGFAVSSSSSANIRIKAQSCTCQILSAVVNISITLCTLYNITRLPSWSRHIPTDSGHYCSSCGTDFVEETKQVCPLPWSTSTIWYNLKYAHSNACGIVWLGIPIAARRNPARTLSTEGLLVSIPCPGSRHRYLQNTYSIN